MPSMKDKIRKTDTYKASRVKREDELRAVQTGQTAAESEPQGRRKKPGKGGTITLAMKPELRNRLKAYCASQGITMSDLVESLVRRKLQEEEVSGE